MRVVPQHLAPQFQVLRRGEVRPDVGGELDDLAERTFDSENTLGLLIRKQERQREKKSADSGGAQSDPNARGAQRAERPHSVEREQRHERSEVKEVIAAAPVLHHERRGSTDQRPRRSRRHESIDAVQRKRHPLRADHLQVRDGGDSIREESVDQAGNERGAPVAGEIANEQIRAEPGERERGNEEQVVAQDDVAGQPVDWKDLQHLSEQMLGQRERERIGMKNVGVPEFGPADRSGQQARHVLRAPAEDPHIEQRVAEIAGHVAAEAERERPRENDCKK